VDESTAKLRYRAARDAYREVARPNWTLLANGIVPSSEALELEDKAQAALASARRLYLMQRAYLQGPYQSLFEPDGSAHVSMPSNAAKNRSATQQLEFPVVPAQRS
jgi:hypothetical protein